jgi:transcriptional regulator with XRE-family HTH domain
MAASKAKKVAVVEKIRAPARPTVAETSGDELGAAEMNRRVSEALKRVRKARDLSLDQLALRSGVSRAALSQIEGGRTNPTLSVLWKVAVGLGISFPELLEMPEGNEPRVMRAGDAVALRSADGRMESRLLSPGGATPSVEVYELRFAAKGLHRSEPHSRGTTETLVVLKGALRVTLEGSDHELMTGDTIFFAADVPHAYENRGSQEARCLNIIHYERMA